MAIENWGQLKDAVPIYGNREGDEQFENLVTTMAIHTLRLIETGLGNIVPSLGNINCDFPYMLKHWHIEKGNSPTTYFLPSSGKIVFSSIVSRICKRIENVSISVGSPDKYKNLIYLPFRDFIAKTGLILYDTAAPSSSATTGIPEYYTYTRIQRSYDVSGDLVIYVSPLPSDPTNTKCYYDVSWYQFTDIESDDDTNWLIQQFPLVVIYAILYEISTISDDHAGMEKYMNLLTINANSLCQFFTSFNESGSLRNIDVTGGINVI